MLKFARLLCLVTICLAVVYFLNDNSPAIAIEFQNHKVSTTLFIFIIAFLFIASFFFILFRAFYLLLMIPASIRKKASDRMYAERFDNLVNAFIAIHCAECEKALTLLRTLKNTHMEPYAKSWLTYWINEITRQDNKKVIGEMINYSETLNFALTILIEKAISLGDIAQALHYLESIPVNSWSTNLRIKGYMKSEMWLELKSFLSLNSIEAINTQRLDSICDYKIAYGIYRSKSDDKEIIKAIELLDNTRNEFEPKIVLQVSLYIKAGLYDDAIHVLAKKWSVHGAVFFYQAIESLEYFARDDAVRIISRITGDGQAVFDILLRAYGFILAKDFQKTAAYLQEKRSCFETSKVTMLQSLVFLIERDGDKIDTNLMGLLFRAIAGEVKKNYYFDLDNMHFSESCTKNSVKIAEINALSL